MTQAPVNQRWHSRVRVAMAATCNARHEARMVDLSVGGAGLEHDTFLRPGDVCALSFALNDDIYMFSARIQWAHLVAPPTPATGAARFRSGLAFRAIPSPARPLLAQLLAR